MAFDEELGASYIGAIVRPGLAPLGAGYGLDFYSEVSALRNMKRASSLEEQLSNLVQRGMVVDEPSDRQWLNNVSYYRLSGYWYGYRVLPPDTDPKNPQRLDSFVSETSFSDVVALYEFDRKLRTLVHDALERIEVALRARVGELLLSKGKDTILKIH